MRYTYYSDVKQGKLQANVVKRIASDLASFNGKRVELSIERLKSKRSARQNRLWWLYMTILSKEIGYTKDEIHEICRFKFLKREKIEEKTGEVLPYIESTTKLGKSEFADMVTDLIRWAAETFSISLPLPDSQVEMEMD